MKFALITSLAALLLIQTNVQAQLIRPTAATAGSEFSSLYDIGNAIDGSGLPPDFTLADLHASYDVNNHWTTQNNAIAAGNAYAIFNFDQAQVLGQFHLWNHRSNNIANNSSYAVTQFDLVFRDAGGSTLFEVLDQTAVGGPGTDAAQTFSFKEVGGVRSVLFRIDSNGMSSGDTGSNYTGVAEVAFSSPVPEPETWAMLLTGLGLLGAAARRNRH